MFCLNGQTFSSLTGRTSGLPYDQLLQKPLYAAVIAGSVEDDSFHNYAEVSLKKRRGTGIIGARK
jgi:hypothetical protein